MPHDHLAASTQVRPFGFSIVVVMDLKYLKGMQKKSYVVLSAVDTGTAWHAGSFLKNRTAKHVSRAFLRT